MPIRVYLLTLNDGLSVFKVRGSILRGISGNAPSVVIFKSFNMQYSFQSYLMDGSLKSVTVLHEPMRKIITPPASVLCMQKHACIRSYSSPPLRF